MDNNRKTAYLTLMDIEVKKSYSNIALNHNIIISKPENQGLVREIVYGVLENKYFIDYAISKFIHTSLEKMKISDKTILRMGIYQIGFMNSVPEYAAVNESVILAKKYCRGRAGFINGVLRSYAREKENIELPSKEEDYIGYLSVKYSYERWIIEEWLTQYDGSFVEDLLQAGNKTPDLVLRVNTLKTEKDVLIKRMREHGYSVNEGHLCAQAVHIKGSKILKTKAYERGLFSVQDESSMMAVNILDPQPGDFIIDVCSAPGGKALAMAEKMNNMGKIAAWDVYRRKLNIVDKEAERLGVTIIETNPWDGTNIKNELVMQADRVLVDAPCSGLGVIRRKPEIKYKELTAELQDLPKKQKAILGASSEYVKPGGVLVYSTCTIAANENKEVIQDFLKRNTEFEQQEIIQLLPNVNDTDGFFICKMIRKNKKTSDG